MVHFVSIIVPYDAGKNINNAQDYKYHKGNHIEFHPSYQIVPVAVYRQKNIQQQEKKLYGNA